MSTVPSLLQPAAGRPGPNPGAAVSGIPMLRATPAPVTGTSAHRSHAGELDALAMLRHDHQQLDELFQAYARMVQQAAPEATRRRLASLICSTLVVHDRLETQLFYPLAREAMRNPAPVDRAREEHLLIGRLVAQIQTTRPSHRGYDQRVARLERLLREHMHFEDEAIFATLQRQGVRFGDLGTVLARWREHLLAHPERGA